MSSLSAENYFKKGLSALVEHSFVDASESFRRALELDRERNKRQPDMRYLSYYGYSLAKGPFTDQIKKGDVLAGKRSLAAEAFERALRLAPEDKTIRAELARVDRRGKPVIPGLSRDHGLNIWLGKLRANMRGRHSGTPQTARS